MCKRIVCSSDRTAIAARFSVRSKPEADALANFLPRWNIAARDTMPVIRLGENHRRELVMLRWGFELDHHLLGQGDGPVSVTALNLRRAALLDDLFPTNRCIVSVDAFYAGPAMQTRGGRTWAFALEDSSIMGIAALWLKHPDGSDRVAFITTGPNESLALIDETMPAILYREDERAWLSASTNPYYAFNLIMPYPAEMMRGWPVAKVDGAERQDGPELLRRVA